jgi:hypothetical protein
MLSFSRLALLALPLFGSVVAEGPTPPTKDVNSIYSSAHEAFQDLLNALPEESLQAALRGLKDFKDGVFETHHRGVEQVHNNNPALATRLIVAAVQDLKKRQNPSNGTTSAAPPPPQQSSAQPPPAESSAAPPAQQSSAAPPAPASSAGNNNPPPAETTTTTADRPIVVTVQQTTTNSVGETVVETTSVLSQVTASVAVTVTRTNQAGQTVTATENRPAVIRTTVDSQGRTATVTTAAQFAPTAGEVRTETDAGGRTFVTTYTPGGGKISSVKLITTTGADGKPSTITSYEFVDPAQTPPPNNNNGGSPTTGKPGLQTGAAVRNGVWGYMVAGGGALALFV